MCSDIPVLPSLTGWLCGAFVSATGVKNTSHEGDTTGIPWLIIFANAPSSCMSDNEYEEGITGQNIRNVALNHVHFKHYFSIAEIPFERERVKKLKARVILGCWGVWQALLVFCQMHHVKYSSSIAP